MNANLAQKARRKVRTALENGTIQRAATCESCGSINKPTADGRSYIHAHHPDHNKPLEIQWLCAKCHRKESTHVWGGPAFGEINGRAKLTENDVLEIRESNESNVALGRRFGVANQTISAARNGGKWGNWGWLAEREKG